MCRGCFYVQKESPVGAGGSGLWAGIADRTFTGIGIFVYLRRNIHAHPGNLHPEAKITGIFAQVRE
jgi:hypothetical protein